MKILITFAGTIENSGGMQNVCIQFANEMFKRGHQVAIAWYGSPHVHTFYPLDKNIPIFTFLPKKIGRAHV